MVEMVIGVEMVIMVGRVIIVVMVIMVIMVTNVIMNIRYLRALSSSWLSGLMVISGETGKPGQTGQI